MRPAKPIRNVGRPRAPTFASCRNRATDRFGSWIPTRRQVSTVSNIFRAHPAGWCLGGREMTNTSLTVSAATNAEHLSWSFTGTRPEPAVTGFYDETTGSIQYVVADPITRSCAIIDPVLDFDLVSGTTRTTSADRLLRHIEAEGLNVEWILDTHPHADHFSAAGYLKDVTG